jgi:hypothetical protein
MSSMERRIENLEKQARFYRLGFFGLCLIVVAMTTMAAQMPAADIDAQVVTCTELRVLDENNNPVVIIFGAEGGNVGVYNTDEKLVAGIGAGERGGYLEAYDNEEKMVADMKAGARGGVLSIYNDKEKTVSRMFVTEFGGAFDLSNNMGESVVESYASELGGVSLLANTEGLEVVQLSADAEGHGVFSLWDRNNFGRTLTPFAWYRWQR